MRLVGLYHSLRGAHTFFLRAGQIDRWGGYTINLIHYEDAASLCLAVRRDALSASRYFRARAFRVHSGCHADVRAAHSV